MGRKLHNQNRQFGVLRLNNRLKKTVFYSVLLSCKIAKRENVVLLSGLLLLIPADGSCKMFTVVSQTFML